MGNTETKEPGFNIYRIDADEPTYVLGIGDLFNGGKILCTVKSPAFDEALNMLAKCYWTYRARNPKAVMNFNYKNLERYEILTFEDLLAINFKSERKNLENAIMNSGTKEGG